MSAKPPLLAQPPKIAGVSAKQPSAQTAPKEAPASLFPRGHEIKIEHRTDPSQYYPYHVDCHCGYHASCYTKEEADNAVAVHWANIKGNVL